MTRKLGDWGFRKNANSSERQAILQNLGPASNPGSFITGGVRITLAKLERWKKRMMGQSSEVIVLRSEHVMRGTVEFSLTCESLINICS